MWWHHNSIIVCECIVSCVHEHFRPRTQKKERVLRISWVPCPFYIQDSILIYFFHGLRRMFPPKKSFHVSGEHGRTTWIRAHSETISSVKIDENRMEIHSNKPKATTEHQRFSAPVPRPWILLACTALVDLARCNFGGSNATQESQVINLCYIALILYHVFSCLFDIKQPCATKPQHKFKQRPEVWKQNGILCCKNATAWLFGGVESLPYETKRTEIQKYNQHNQRKHHNQCFVSFNNYAPEKETPKALQLSSSLLRLTIRQSINTSALQCRQFDAQSHWPVQKFIGLPAW